MKIYCQVLVLLWGGTLFKSLDSRWASFNFIDVKIYRMVEEGVIDISLNFNTIPLIKN